MALPINIEDLLNKNKVESDRIEFKKGWNPVSIYRSICAFANDIDNIGGGYILVGVEEENGVAKRPVCGLSDESLDKIHREILQYNQLIEPSYAPRLSVEEIDGGKILVIWVTSGNNRPYTAPSDVTAKFKKPVFYIRYGTSSVEAKGEFLDQLRDMANRVPFDDRGNENISLSDISPLLLKDYLGRVGSRLAKVNFTSSLVSVLEQMDLYDGPIEKRQIKNVAAMMFSENPAKFFKETQVEIVIFPEGRENNPDNMMEVAPIKGPIPKVISDTLSYFRTNVIKEQIRKTSDSEKSIRFFNYPFQAIEEAVVNALYHRNYQEREPVEITIEPDRVSILSYSGPDRTISMQAIKEAKSLRSRRYRNRRLGEFLKELELTEGRATGIPTIQKALSENGSSLATIETDESRTYFLMDIPCHPDFVKNVLVDVQVECLDLKQVAIKISQLCPSYRLVVSQSDIEKLAQCLLRATTEVSGHDMLDGIDTTSYKQRKRKYLDQLITMGLVEMTKPDKPTASDQKYRCTTLGKQMIMGDRTIKS